MSSKMERVALTNPEDFVLFESLQRAREIAHACMQEEKLTKKALKKAGVLPFLQEDKLLLKFNRLGPPLASEHVAQLIRDTLRMEGGSVVRARDVKEAVLCALLTPLRQSVGSCFATAPAIMIQEEQPENLLHDLFDLVTLGRLVKTIEGEEIKSPIALSYGSDVIDRPLGEHGVATLSVNLALQHPDLEGCPIPSHVSPQATLRDVIRQMLGLKKEDRVELEDPSPFAVRTSHHVKRQAKIKELLKKEAAITHNFNTLFVNPLLKAWEFTLATFTDYKIDAFRWNMLVALGFDPKMEGGVGELIYGHLEQRLKDKNEELLNMQQEVERSHYQVEATHALLKNATNPDRVRQLKAQASAQLSHLQTSEELMHDLKEETQYLSQFYNFMTEQYDALFRLYFQEVYDPQMRVNEEAFYADCPAGFRLVYKFGRAEPSVWQPIYDKTTYLELLRHFFTTVEPILINACEWEKGKDEINAITERILVLIMDEAFIKSATKRVKEKAEFGKEKTPWSYVSGGTLDTLVRCYVKRDAPLSVEEIHPKSVEDLAIEMIEVMKELPQATLDHPSLLLQTPTHACLLKPQWLEIAYSQRQFTYTWLRDHIVEPGIEYYTNITLYPDEQNALLTTLAGELPQVIIDQICEPSKMPLIHFESKLVHLDLSRDILRGFFVDQFPNAPKLYFADTNWVDYYFSFQVNPVTHKLDLFRSTRDGQKSLPMTQWANYFREESPPWKIYTKPSEWILHRDLESNAKKA